jgi:hypothetical protein
LIEEEDKIVIRHINALGRKLGRLKDYKKKKHKAYDMKT